MQRWSPPMKCSDREEKLLKLATKSRKLFAFLREHRHEIFDAAFQSELEAMYRNTGQGAEPQPPALMCMAVVLAGYQGVSDAEAVRLSAQDLCWRSLLGTIEGKDDTPAFSQGGLQQFRDRFIAHGMDRRLLERTIELAKKSKDFDWRKLPKTLRVAVDSRPLEGAGRVEDTFNLLGHAGRKIAECIAAELDMSIEEVCKKSNAPVLLASSTKAGLDIDWNVAEQKAEALNRLCEQLDRLSQWVAKRRPEQEQTKLSRYIDALAQVKKQDVEPAPDEAGVQLRQGVAEDRRVSIEDPEMRHGRKSKSKRFNGYKQHFGTHLDAGLVLACAVTPANRPEEEAAPALAADMARMDFVPDELQIDRAYINSALAELVGQRGGTVLSKPWKGTNAKSGMFGKRDFKINVRDSTITCPAGEVEPFESGQVVHFDPEACGPCPLRGQCTHAATGRGRTVTMGDDERLQKRLRKLQSTRAGREKLRGRTPVEHRLAHLSNRQGVRARYRGVRRNEFDLRRQATIQNFEVIARVIRKATAGAAEQKAA
jgi:Transposase DDE domain